MSLFKYGLNGWAAGYKGKTLDPIDGFTRREVRFGYTCDATAMSVILNKRIASDENHILHKIFPDKRNRVLCEREHEYSTQRQDKTFQESFYK